MQVKNLFIGAILVLLISSCRNMDSNKETYDFSFAFLTDIHVQPENNAIEGFTKAISKVNELKPDFVVTGGDLIMDALEQTYERSDSLFNIYDTLEAKLQMPVYNTIGNHEIFAWFNEGEEWESHPEYGKQMPEKRLNINRYYAFDRNGWRFYIFDSVAKDDSVGYKGFIDAEQMEWLKNDLAKVDKNTPIAISTHIPLATVWTQLNYGAEQGNFPGVIITNSQDVLALFNNHNLKLVLQGHLHFYENIEARGVHFITGGAVSSRWWHGKNKGLEEGFLMVKVKGEDFDVEYIDYGWNANNNTNK